MMLADWFSDHWFTKGDLFSFGFAIGLLIIVGLWAIVGKIFKK